MWSMLSICCTKHFAHFPLQNFAKQRPLTPKLNCETINLNDYLARFLLLDNDKIITARTSRIWNVPVYLNAIPFELSHCHFTYLLTRSSENRVYSIFLLL